MSEIKKMVKDGKVAVLISPEYGAGWYTWNRNKETGGGEQLLFSPELVAAVLAGAKPKELVALAKDLFPDAYEGGAGNLEVRWLPVGAKFDVDEYDGFESLRVVDEEQWLIA